MFIELDDLDVSILKELRTNSRLSHRKLATKLGVHPNTLLQRVKRLEEARVILNYQADVDYGKIGYDVHAIALIKIKRTGLEDRDLLKDIIHLPEIMAMYALTGSNDIMAIIRAKERDGLLNVLQRIQSNKSVLRTTTHLILMTYKRPSEFNPLLEE